MKDAQSGSYDTLLTMLTESIKDATKQVQMSAFSIVESAKDYMVAAEELNTMDANFLVDSLKKDLQTFRYHYHKDMENSQWLDDGRHVFWQTLYKLSDHSQIEWAEFPQDLEHHGEYKKGELVGLGDLECINCKGHLQFYHPQILGECPHCEGNRFIRRPLEG